MRSSSAATARNGALRSKFDVPHELECTECEGRGYTPLTAQRGSQDKSGKYHTTTIGSGCPECQGIGRLEPL